MNRVSILAPQQVYLFVFKYLVILSELLELDVAAVALALLEPILLLLPLQVRVDEQHPGNSHHCNHCTHVTLKEPKIGLVSSTYIAGPEI